MLVLSRKTGQEIRIGNVRIVVVGRRGDRIRIGIEAPPEVRVERGELVRAAERTQPVADAAEVEVELVECEAAA